MKRSKIFNIDYLINEELTEDDLYYIFETTSLERSLHLYMCRLIKPEITERSALLLGKKDKWWETLEWTKQTRNTAIKNIMKAYMNIYQISKREALAKSQMYVLLYGPNVKNNKFLTE